jgi:hypothetical protein
MCPRVYRREHNSSKSRTTMKIIRVASPRFRPNVPPSGRETPKLGRLANPSEKVSETLHDDARRFEPSVLAQTSSSEIIVIKKLRQDRLTLSFCGHTVSSRMRPSDSRPR